MAAIAYILLCHRDPDGIIAQARRLAAHGDFVAIHFDARARSEDYARVRAALDGNPSVAFAARRLKCGWGEWSLVGATLEAVKAAERAFPAATHFYMLSGDCMPIKPVSYIHDFLDRDDVDYIESFDFFTSDWIRTGLKEDRLTYRHFFNERNSKGLFYTSYRIQKRLGLRRRVPEGLRMMIGSQWWCLRRRTIEAILKFCRARRDIVRFFKTTWIPDETFFQTITRHLVPAEQIRSRTLTFLMFSDYGMPVLFFNDQYDLLASQDHFFARKISPDARDLRERLGALYDGPAVGVEITGEGHRLYQFVAGRGRVGRRFRRRMWEDAASLGADRTLMVIACKKWHVAKRLTAAIRQRTNLAVLDYLFDEEAADLPDLGGIGSTLAKRGRHVRAVSGLILDALGTERLVLCVDPARFDLVQDLAGAGSTFKVLQVECEFSDDYLEGHARRIGLTAPATAPGTVAALLPTVRADVAFEVARIRDSGLPNIFRLRENATLEEKAMALAGFLDISGDTALTIAATDHLFAD